MQTIQAFCIISLIVSLAYAVPTAPDKWTANVVGHEFRNNINTTFNGVWAQDTQGGLSYESGVGHLLYTSWMNTNVISRLDLCQLSLLAHFIQQLHRCVIMKNSCLPVGTTHVALFIAVMVLGTELMIPKLTLSSQSAKDVWFISISLGYQKPCLLVHVSQTMYLVICGWPILKTLNFTIITASMRTLLSILNL